MRAILLTALLLLSGSAAAQSTGVLWTGPTLPNLSGDMVYCADTDIPTVGPCRPDQGMAISLETDWVVNVMMQNVYCPDFECAEPGVGRFTVYGSNGAFGVFHWAENEFGGYTVVQLWHGIQCYSQFMNACNQGGPPPDTGSLGG